MAYVSDWQIVGYVTLRKTVLHKFRVYLLMVVSCCSGVFNCSLVYAETANNRILDNLIEARDSYGNTVALEEIAPDDYEGFIVEIKSDTPRSELNTLRKKVAKCQDNSVQELYGQKVYYADSIDDAADYIPYEMVDYIEPNYTIHQMNVVNKGTVGTDGYSTSDPLYKDNKWLYSQINIQPVWQKGIKGRNSSSDRAVCIAVLDSGLAGYGIQSISYPKHEDLNYSNMIAASSVMDSSTCDRNGHGTFVIGEIAALHDNEKGVAGILPDAEILSYKVIDSDGEGNISDAIFALDDIRENYRNVDVVNMSLGSEHYSSSFQAACNRLANTGVILVASAGNDGNRVYNYPASYDNVISVAATNKYGSTSFFSQHNNMVDIAAPGEDILGLGIANSSDYCYHSGTSMSSPIVAAIAAMVKSIDKTVNHDKFVELLKDSSVDAGPNGYDEYFGWGIPDCDKLVQMLIRCDTHAMGDWVTVQESTCTKEGLEQRSCRNCYYTETRKIDKTGHDCSDWIVKYEPTCEYMGEKVGYCSKCNYTVKVVTPATKHNYEEVIKKPKVGFEGLSYLECSNCGKIIDETVIPALRPSPTVIRSQSSGKTSITIKWTRRECTGYQVRYSRKSSMSNAKKYITTDCEKSSVTIKKLQRKTRYYFQIRTVFSRAGNSYYSQWSTRRMIKTKG